MSKNTSLFNPVLAKRKGKNADKKTWTNLQGSSASLAIYHGACNAESPVLLLTHDTPSAIKIEQELKSLNTDNTLSICLFPDWETLPYDTFSPHQDIISQRLATLYQLSRMEKGVVIVPVCTLLQRIAPKKYLDLNSLLIKKGDKKDLHQLRQELEASGYRAVDQVMEHGEFCARGAIIDLFPMGSKSPFRLDFFDDEIDEIRLFDPESQRSSDKVEGIDLLPAHEFPTDKAGTNLFRSQYREIFSGNIPKESVYHQVSNGILPAGIEYYLPLFFDETNTLCDYLSENTLVIISGDIDKAQTQFWSDAQFRYEDRKYDTSRPLLAPEKLFLNSEELYSALKPYDRITLKAQEQATNNESDTVNEGNNTPTKSGTVHFDVNTLPDLTVDHKLKQPFELLTQFK